ncbi:IclR family transcriptional regulator [Streptomyces sp. 2A115]|uniref:IclR family transcriptional regulator n=1 Tax=Streptomyces sp. 2A115 TaxID=3457439 RepID=UPI003FD0F092
MLGKAHLLLGAFASDAPSLGLTELSRRSGVRKATVHRLATELVQLGYLTRTAGGYQLGWRIFELGQLVPGPAGLRSVARPALIDLRTATKSVIHLAVPHGVDCVYLERLGGRREARVLTAVGTTVPSWLTASGRIFLAHREDRNDILAALDEAALAPLAPHGIGDVSQFIAHLEMIRKRRWADEQQQCVQGFKTFAVPIMYGASDRVISAVSATMPVERCDDQRIVHALWAAAADISRSLHGPVAALHDDSPYWTKLVG